LLSEILRRTVDLEFEPLSDEELTLNAEDVFIALDEEEDWKQLISCKYSLPSARHPYQTLCSQSYCMIVMLMTVFLRKPIATGDGVYLLPEFF
jgi:hypothetical protein